jgi:hypothetical protein
VAALNCTGYGACEKPNGDACVTGTECASNYCVDGVCCGTACTATCYACSAAKTGGTSGTCAAITFATDPDVECPAGYLCNGAGVCKGADGTACNNKNNCLSGNCPLTDRVCCDAACDTLCVACTSDKTGVVTGDCSFVLPYTDPENECAAPPLCNGNGGCALADGAACTAGLQCVSGHCVDGVCCDSACTATCAGCTAALTGGGNGDCLPIPAHTDPQSECPGADACDGTYACRHYDGAACSTGNECFSTFCVDGVCCESSCDAECMACSASKTSGTSGDCLFIPSGNDPDGECPGPKVCTGTGDCI